MARPSQGFLTLVPKGIPTVKAATAIVLPAAFSRNGFPSPNTALQHVDGPLAREPCHAVTPRDSA